MDRYYPESNEQVRDLQEFKWWLGDELRRISAVINSLIDGHQEVAYGAPFRLREGDVRRADGSNWDPASVGAGFIWYTGTQWRYLWDKKIKFDAVTNPAKTDNGSNGYSTGSLWINQSAGAAYMMTRLDSANASANWVAIT